MEEKNKGGWGLQLSECPGPGGRREVTCVPDCLGKRPQQLSGHHFSSVKSAEYPKSPRVPARKVGRGGAGAGSSSQDTDLSAQAPSAPGNPPFLGNRSMEADVANRLSFPMQIIWSFKFSLQPLSRLCCWASSQLIRKFCFLLSRNLKTRRDHK